MMLKLPTDLLAQLGLAAGLVLVGFISGYQVRGNRQEKAEQRQEVKVAKVEAKQDQQVEDQNDADSQKIEDLERRVADLRARGPRIIRVRDAGGGVPQTQGDADAGRETGAGEGRCVRGPEVDRGAVLIYAQEKAELRAAIRSCQAQWPR